MSEIYTWTREEFIRFLENTLIPDLKESGRHSTAEDFETAVFFMDTIPMRDTARRRFDEGHTGLVIQRQKRVFERSEA